MTEAEQLFQRARIEVRLIDYWHDLDRNWGRNAASYYTQNASFGGPAESYQGREAITEYYTKREQRGERTTVHAVQNFRATFSDDKTAETQAYLIGYAAKGKPILPAAAPVVISMLHDRYEKQDDGIWLCADRNFEVLFTGS